MKKIGILLCMVMAMVLLCPKTAFAQAGELVEAVVPETIFVNQINNVLIKPDEPIIQIEATYYLPVSPTFMSVVGKIPIWNDDSSALHLAGESIDARDMQLDSSDPYLEEYKREVSVVSCNPIAVTVETANGVYETEARYRNQWSEVWYIPITTEFVEGMNWELYDLGNFGQYLFLYNFTEEDRKAFMSYQREINAMAKYMTIINKRLPLDRAAYYVQLVKKTSQKYDVEDKVILAIMWQESWYDESCTYINAVGMMQMLRSTGASMGVTPEQLLDPAINIDVCVNYLTRDRAYFDGDLEKAIHAYNQGSFRVVKNTHKTWYYEEVIEKYTKIEAYIQKKVAGL